MATERTPSRSLKSLAGLALAGAGLFILLGNLDRDRAQLSHLLDAGVGKGFGLLSSVVLAASLNRQWIVERFLEMLVSFWPLLLVVLGATWLRDFLPSLRPEVEK